MLDEITEYRLRKIDEMNRHKWLESEKAGKDLGEKAIAHWKRHHEFQFHRHWVKTRYHFI